jgi:hypothetical protein
MRGNSFLQGLVNLTYMWTYFTGINLKEISPQWTFLSQTSVAVYVYSLLACTHLFLTLLYKRLQCYHQNMTFSCICVPIYGSVTKLQREV